MKRKIVVEYGEVRRIAHLMNCTPEFVSRSLSFAKDTRLAKSVRKMAILRSLYPVACLLPKILGWRSQ